MTSDDAQATYDRMRYESYLAHRQTLIQIETDQTRSFDKAMLSVASGALGLSIAFSHELTSGNPQFPWLLFASWFIFCGSILSTTCSFLIAARASARQREIFDAAFETESEIQELRNPFGPWVERLNTLSLVVIFSGVLCLTSFAVANFEKRSEEAHRRTTATEAAGSSPAKYIYSDHSASVTGSGRMASYIGPTTFAKYENPNEG